MWQQRWASAGGTIMWPDAEKEIWRGKPFPLLVQRCDDWVSIFCQSCSQNKPAIQHNLSLWKCLLYFGPTQVEAEKEVEHWAINCLLSPQALKLWSRVKHMPNCLTDFHKRQLRWKKFHSLGHFILILCSLDIYLTHFCTCSCHGPQFLTNVLWNALGTRKYAYVC